MIKSFKHKGLEGFFKTGAARGINKNHSKKIRLVLAMLDAAVFVKDIDAPGLRLHKLKGERKSDYSVTVSGNWRITFQFRAGDVYIVNYEDYH
ncbi:MAG: type II toxin-antitoxin system RelE/ParE family toxin [Gammaproteobacteria bacterium]|nr:type II toxin-antitoxin system RelE/ParE family toxin [Gammaproteobacteria bacterium]